MTYTNDEAFSLERAISRLYEMQSSKYLFEPHFPHSKNIFSGDIAQEMDSSGSMFRFDFF